MKWQGRLSMTKSNIILICASPRRKGTSVMLLERIRVVTGGEIVFLPQKGSPDKLISDMKHAETIVISGPCYINTYPAKLIELLETASAAGGFTGQKIYGIINGGMPYIHTHQHGLTCLKLFAEQTIFVARRLYLAAAPCLTENLLKTIWAARKSYRLSIGLSCI